MRIIKMRAKIMEIMKIKCNNKDNDDNENEMKSYYESDSEIDCNGNI